MVRSSMGRSVVVALIIGMGTIAGRGASAEESSPTSASPRVRVTAPTVSGTRLVGTLLRMDEATLTLRRKGGKEVIEVPRRAITRMEVSRRPSKRGKGAGIGALIGLGAAVAIGVAEGEDCSGGKWLCFDTPTMVLASSILTIPAGTVLGLVFAPGESWVAATPERLRLAVTPARGGVGVALSLRF
jgi:hypothetical protein